MSHFPAEQGRVPCKVYPVQNTVYNTPYTVSTQRYRGSINAVQRKCGEKMKINDTLFQVFTVYFDFHSALENNVFIWRIAAVLAVEQC